VEDTEVQTSVSRSQTVGEGGGSLYRERDLEKCGAGRAKTRSLAKNNESPERDPAVKPEKRKDVNKKENEITRESRGGSPATGGELRLMWVGDARCLSKKERDCEGGGIGQAEGN